MAIEFFGKVDKSDDGKTIKSAMPAWYFDVHIEELEESVLRKERAIKRGDIQPGQLQQTKADLEREKVRLAEIKTSKPILSDRDKDAIYKTYKELQGHIRESLPPRSDEMMGLTNPREELSRMKNPCIPIDKAMAKACGVKADKNGKISRDAAVRCYRIMGKTLGEDTNTERLRRDGKNGTYHSMNDMTEAILKGVQGIQPQGA